MVAASQFLQEDDIAELKRSRSIVGELSDVVWDDRRDECVSGVHRLKAGFKKVRHIRTKDDPEFFRLKLHYNLQRNMPPDEKVSMLSAYGDALLAAGWKPGRALMDEICANSFWEPSYTYEMTPKRFKSPNDQGNRGPNVFRPPEKQRELPPGIEPATEAGPHLITCSKCGFRGVDVAGQLTEQ